MGTQLALSMPPSRERYLLSASACCCLVGPMAYSYITAMLVISVAPVPASDNRCRTIACRSTSNVTWLQIATTVCCHCINTSHALCAHDLVDHKHIAKNIQPCAYVYSVLAVFAQTYLHDADFAWTCSLFCCHLCLVSAYLIHVCTHVTSSIAPYIHLLLYGPTDTESWT